jgi:hypothetical protein
MVPERAGEGPRGPVELLQERKCVEQGVDGEACVSPPSYSGYALSFRVGRGRHHLGFLLHCLVDDGQLLCHQIY